MPLHSLIDFVLAQFMYRILIEKSTYCLLGLLSCITCMLCTYYFYAYYKTDQQLEGWTNKLSTYLLFEETMKEVYDMQMLSLGILSDIQNGVITFADLESVDRKANKITKQLDEIANVYEAENKVRLNEARDAFQKKSALIVARLQSLLKLDGGLKVENVRKNIYYDFKDLLHNLQKSLQILKQQIPVINHHVAQETKAFYLYTVLYTSVTLVMILLLLYSFYVLHMHERRNIEYCLHSLALQHRDDIYVLAKYRMLVSRCLSLKAFHHILYDMLNVQKIAVIVFDTQGLVIEQNNYALNLLQSMGLARDLTNLSDLLQLYPQLEPLYQLSIQDTKVLEFTLPPFYSGRMYYEEAKQQIIVAIYSQAELQNTMEELQQNTDVPMEDVALIADKAHLLSAHLAEHTSKAQDALEIAQAIFISTNNETHEIVKVTKEMNQLFSVDHRQEQLIHTLQKHLEKGLVNSAVHEQKLEQISVQLIKWYKQIQALALQIEILLQQNNKEALNTILTIVMSTCHDWQQDIGLLNQIYTITNDQKDNRDNWKKCQEDMTRLLQYHQGGKISLQDKQKIMRSVVGAVDKSLLKLRGLMQQMEEINNKIQHHNQTSKALSLHLIDLSNKTKTIKQKVWQQLQKLGILLKVQYKS